MSYRRFFIAIVCATFLSALRTASAQNVPRVRIDPADMKNIILVKDIKPGMKGYGKTVFRGVTPETFQVTVLGVLDKAYFGTERILVKLSGGPMTTRGANTIEGMSGSPIYINGKIAGAFAYGMPYGKEPIGMVTPIQYMLDAWDPSLPSKPSSFYPFGAASLNEPIPLDGRTYGKVAIDWGQDQGSVDADSDTLLLAPLATPLMVSGMSPRVMARLAESLRPLNIRPVAGPGIASDKANIPSNIQPGSSIGVSFVTGDVDMTGIGTVTYRRGDRILAFGHPMFENPMMNGIGAVKAPLMSTYVYDVFPSIQFSTKLAAPIKPIGTAFQDRPWGIGAKLGELPSDMIPVTVTVKDLARNRTKDFHVKVINHPLVAAPFIVASVSEAVFEMRGNPSDVTADVRYEVVADEVGTIKRENRYFDAVAIDAAAVTELNQLLSMLQFNPFYPVAVKSVTVTVTMQPKHDTARLERIFLKEGKFEPGDKIEIGAVLRPFKGERITKTITLELPKNTANGKLTVEVSGGGASRSVMAPDEGPGALSLTPAPVGSSSIENLQQMIKKFLERNKNNELVARIVLPKSVPSIGGEKLAGLPPSIADAMKSSKTSVLGLEREEIKTVMPMDSVIFGSQRLSITVQKADKSEKKTVKRSSDSSSDSGSDSSSTDEPPPDESTEPDALSAQAISPIPAAASPALPAPSAGAEIKPAKVEPAKPAEPEASEEKPATEEAEKPAPPTPPIGTNEKPVGRAATSWKQTTRTEFLGGTFKNVTATTGDLLMLAGSVKPLADTGEAYAWCIQPDGNGGSFVGTGNHGIIYRVAADGAISPFYDSPEFEIQSLKMDRSGNLYAGTAPNGIIYKITPDGKATVLFDAAEKYIVALAFDTKDNLYAATGDKCKVYRISPDGKAQPVLDSSEYYALSLAVDKDDNVYVGTGLSGIIYKIPPGGSPSVLYDAADDSVTALALDQKGTLFAGTSPKGMILKLASGSTPKTIYDKADKGVLGMASDEYGNVYAVSAMSIFKVAPDDKVATLENEKDLQFLSVAVGAGSLYAGTGNVGSIYTAPISKALEGTFESPIHDCGLPSKWGLISWTAELRDGGSVALQTRTGDNAEPDSTWSDWSAPYAASGAKVVSPPGRYIQYKATVRASSASASPKLKDIAVVYLPRNQGPKVTLTDPKGGDKWAGKKTIKWTGTDPDKDTLSYEVFYSTDSGATWQPLKDKIQKPAADKKPKDEKPATDKGDKPAPVEEVSKAANDEAQQMVAEMSAELDKHPEIPQDVKDQILADAGTDTAADETAPVDEAADSTAAPKDETASSGNGTKQTSMSWDTKKVKDGAYLVKVIGSDRLSNAVDALTAEAISDLLTICNTAPKVSVFKHMITVLPDKTVRFDGYATQDNVGIAGVQYRIGKDDWASAAANDGIFDTGNEPFTVTTQVLKPGDYTIEVKVIDQAGNSATTKVTAKVQ